MRRLPRAPCAGGGGVVSPVRKCHDGHLIAGDNAVRVGKQLVCRTCQERVRVIRPQHGAVYRIVTRSDRVLDRVQFDATRRVFASVRRGSRPPAHEVPLEDVALLSRRAAGGACGWERFCRLPASMGVAA